MSDSFAAGSPQDHVPLNSPAPRAVPSAQPGWIDVFLGTLVAPCQTFRLLSEREQVHWMSQLSQTLHAIGAIFGATT